MEKKKNIIFLMSDQMQAAVTDETNDYIMPNLKQLVSDGVCCQHSYGTNPICSPSRASLMTAMLPHSHGVIDVAHIIPERGEYDYSLDTFTNRLKDNGYSLAYYGKWHVEREHQLQRFGYDEYKTEFELPKSNFTPVQKLVLSGAKTGYPDRVIGGTYKESPEASEEHYIFSQAIDFISRHSDGPFFTFISTNAPHDPYTAPQAFYELYKDKPMDLPKSFSDDLKDKPNLYSRLRSVFEDLSEDDYKEVRRYYHAYCSLIDYEYGRMIKYLKDNDLYDDTLIVVLSDHGDYQGAHGLLCKGVAAFEEAYRIPLVFKMPENANRGTRTDAIFSIADIGPTVLDIACGDKLKNDCYGKTKRDALEGQSTSYSVMAENFGQRYGYSQRIVWKDTYKYVFNTFDFDELYDLKNDPLELHNLASDEKYHEIKISMAREMQTQIRDTKDESMQESTYFMLRFAPVGPYKKIGNSDYTIYNKLF